MHLSKEKQMTTATITRTVKSPENIFIQGNLVQLKREERSNKKVNDGQYIVMVSNKKGDSPNLFHGQIVATAGNDGIEAGEVISNFRKASFEQFTGTIGLTV
jgi:ribosomal protein L35AE/L33A